MISIDYGNGSRISEAIGLKWHNMISPGGNAAALPGLTHQRDRV
jgi:hypothetical protein